MLPGAVLLAAGLAATTPVATGSTGQSRLGGRAEVGYDTYRERYSIADEDTLDEISEVRTRLRLAYTAGSYTRNYYFVEARGTLGQSDYSAGLRLRFLHALPGNRRSRISLDGDALRQQYRPGGNYSYPNDFTRYYLRGYARAGLGASLSLRADDRLEVVDYDNRTEFDYDYIRNTTTIAAEYEHDYTTYASAGLRHTTMSIPDSSEIQYRSWTPFVEFRAAPEFRRQLYAQAAVERRLYDVGTARSRFSAWTATIAGEWAIREPVGVIVEDNLESYRYDDLSDIYFNYVENRLVALCALHTSWYSRVGVGGTYAMLSSGQSPTDEYREFGLVVRWEYTRGTALWISAEYEPGHRRYPSFDPDAVFDSESIYSNFTYHRLGLFANARLWHNVGFSVFADYRPEDHTRQGDDATATLFSANVFYDF